MAATVLADSGKEQKVSNNIFQPGKYNNCTLNSEIDAKWRCSRGEIGTDTRDKQYQAVCSRSKAEKNELHKNGKNV